MFFIPLKYNLFFLPFLNESHLQLITPADRSLCDQTKKVLTGQVAAGGRPKRYKWQAGALSGTMRRFLSQ
jgi:hypothetical protein